uniref:Uncharacterized protein n=1 Tax=Arundo donax TaxID=35708 RepID=A0A0A9EMU8_ARUDO
MYDFLFLLLIISFPDEHLLCVDAVVHIP